MINRNLMIAVAISVIVFMGFVFVTNMTGNVITGSVVGGGQVVENELFRIDDFGMAVNETGEINDTQNNSGSR